MIKQVMGNNISYRIVSLGCFCGVAQEMGRIGLRDGSYPFDWLISSSFEKVIELIKSNFSDFLEKNSFFQSTQNPDYYYNNKSKCWFYHDFTKFADFDSQYCVVRCKYEKRIRRFYNAISKPTIFLRYIDNQADADFINRNEQDILNFLQSFCPDNKLYYIYNDNLFCTAQNSFAVKIDENDTVARNFFTQLPLLEKNLKSNYYDKSLIAYNSKRYMKSQNIGRKIVKKIKKIFSNYFCHTYIHDRKIEK